MDAVVLELPLAGPCLVQNSPARRIPSHGTELMGSSHAIDLVPVDERGRTAARGWRSVAGWEPPDRFVGFGMPVLSPVDGRVAAVLDGVADHVARRSVLSLVPYAAGQARRLRDGIRMIAGNHVVIELPDRGVFVALVHLKLGSLRVRVGDPVRVGQQLAECGNSGNSTEPHVHLQAMDAVDPMGARGVPFVFREFRERGVLRTRAIPGEGAIVTLR